MRPSDYEHVPLVDEHAEVDPHWLELRGSSGLPSIYLPPPMAGSHSPVQRATAIVLAGVFLLATAAGVCLTFGPQVFGG